MKYVAIKFPLSGTYSRGIGPVEFLNIVDSCESVIGERANLRVEPRWRMTSPSVLDFVASIIGGDRAIFGKVVRCEFEISMLALVQVSTSSLVWRKEARCASQIPAYFVSSSERGWTLG